MGECGVMAQIVDLEARRITPYVLEAIAGFIGDPPDSQFQRGYLSALLDIYREGLGNKSADARVVAAEEIMKRTRGMA